MTETTQDAYVKGYNQGRKDEADSMRQSYESALQARATAVQLLPEGGFMFKTPDVTPVQIVAVVGACLAAAAAFGFDLSQQQQDAVMQLVAVVAALLLGGDAVIRHGRATGSAKKD